MTDPVNPAGRPDRVAAQRRLEERRTGDRRKGNERREGEAAPSKAMVPAGERRDHPADPPAPENVSPSAFAAQIIGQDGQRKGLKGGPPVLDAARSTYLGAEYSGAADRRPRPGKVGKTDI